MLNTLVKSPPRKKLLRFAVFILVGFLLGGLAAYVTNMRANRFAAQQVPPSQQQSGNASSPFTVIHDGERLKLVPKGEVSAGTEDPSVYKAGEAEAGAAGAIAAAMKTAESEKEKEAAVEEDEALVAARRQREMFLQAHQQPNIGMYVPGDFTLMDEQGNEVTEKSWPGKYLMVFFGFTQCPDVCPVTLNKIASVLEDLGSLAEKVQPLFITVDPERDTMEVMKSYTDKFNKELVGLTGTMAQVLAAEAAFKVYASKSTRKTLAAAYSMDHTAYVYFMSPQNQLEEIFRIEQSTKTVAERIRPYLMGTAKKK